MAIPLSGKTPLNRKMTPHDGTRHVCRERCNSANRSENIERDHKEKFIFPQKSEISFNVIFIREIDCISAETVRGVVLQKFLQKAQAQRVAKYPRSLINRS